MTRDERVQALEKRPVAELVRDLKSLMMDRLDAVTADGHVVEELFEAVLKREEKKK